MSEHVGTPASRLAARLQREATIEHLQAENARLARERDEARAEVAEFDEVVFEWARMFESIDESNKVVAEFREFRKQVRERNALVRAEPVAEKPV